MTAPTLSPGSRLDIANGLLETIATFGRRFFSHDGRVARLELDHRGRVWFHDHYTGLRIYTHYAGRWRGFTSGGTMRSLIENLRDYIKRGERLHPMVFGPWPDWFCGGDLWGYGDDMEKVRTKARDTGCLAALQSKGVEGE